MGGLLRKMRTLHTAAAPSMITLYHRPQTRSSRFIFLLEEFGAPYQSADCQYAHP